MTTALTSSFQLASKKLPRGCRPDPASWVTPEVHDAMERRDFLRITAETSDLPEDWAAWAASAKDTQKLINRTKRLQWRDFCNSLSHRSDPGKVMKVLKAINAHPTTPSTHILMGKDKACATDVAKARAFRSHYAKILHPSTASPQTRDEKRIRRKQKISNRLYAKRPDADFSSDFTLAELRLALLRLHPRKACGPDGIYNEFLTHASPLIHNLLLQIAQVAAEVAGRKISPLPSFGSSLSMRQ